MTTVALRAGRCHDGEKCLVHVSPPAMPDVTKPPRGKTLFGELLRSFVAGLDAVHGAALAPEELLAIRLASEAGDLGGLLEHHCDLTLLALASRSPAGRGLANRLASALGQALALGWVEEGAAALAECLRLARATDDPFIAEHAVDIVRQALAAAPRGLLPCLPGALPHAASVRRGA